MIASVTGKVLEVRIDGLVINLGGLGMFVLCAPDLIATAQVGQEISVQTALIVREDSLTLFGFETANSRELFDLVQSVSGFGPKLAFTILSSMSPDDFRTAIANEDLVRLKQTPGVGAKGAQRLILELKDRIGVLPNKGQLTSSDWQTQVEQGLVGLGWTIKEANRAVQEVAEEVTDTDPEVSKLLKRALQILGN